MAIRPLLSMMERIVMAGRIAMRPYDIHDAVKMIRHHHKFTAFDF